MLPLHASGQAPASAHYLGGSCLPPPLYRIIHALQQLPSPASGDITNTPTYPAEWCAAMPIVGNPYLVNGRGEGLRGEALDFLCIGASTLGRVLILDKLLSDCASDAAWDHGPWRALVRGAANHWRDRDVARGRVDFVLSYVPLQWQAAAKVHVHTDAWPYVEEQHVYSVAGEYQKVAADLVHHHLAWSHASLPRSPVSVPMLTVQQAYAMLLQPVSATRVGNAGAVSSWRLVIWVPLLNWHLIW